MSCGEIVSVLLLESIFSPYFTATQGDVYDKEGAGAQGITGRPRLCVLSHMGY